MYRRELLFITSCVVALASAACSVEQTRDAELPDVDIKGGQLPKFDLDPAKVNVGTDTQTVVVPNVDVTPKEGGNP